MVPRRASSFKPPQLQAQADSGMRPARYAMVHGACASRQPQHTSPAQTQLTSLTTRSVVLTVSPFSSVCCVKSISGTGMEFLLRMAAMALAVWVVGDAIVLGVMLGRDVARVVP